MSAYNDKRRDLKRPYRKKAFQTGMSQVSKTVDSHPLPPHSYSTTTHLQTSPVRKGVDPRTYQRDVRPAVESLDNSRSLNMANYPWNNSPKPDSANVIARGKIDFTVVANQVPDNSFLDVLVLNLANVVGAQPATPAASAGVGAADRGQAPDEAAVAIGEPTGAITPAGAAAGDPRFPSAAGIDVAGVAGTVTIAAPGDVYMIRSFGHSEITNANLTGGVGPINTANPIIYQIWVDGQMMMEWQNFQFAAVTPQNQQWQFLQPLSVTKQIVLRIVNKTNVAITLGEMESCFVGWSEQRSNYEDVSHVQLENS